MNINRKTRTVISQLLIALVFVINVQCAIVFIFDPSSYIHGFGLTGQVGEQMVRAMGLLFLMWNVPYGFALLSPIKNKTSLKEAVLMQAIGLVGELGILLVGGPYTAVIDATINRFILFDGIGLFLLIFALINIGMIEEKATLSM